MTEQIQETARAERTVLSGGAVQINMGLLLAGLVLQVVGLIVPAFLTVEDFGIYETLTRAIREEREFYVLAAAMEMIALNTCRAVPHYLGTFFLAESIHNVRLGRWPVVSMAVICVMIPGTYVIFDLVHGVHLDFGIPSLSMIATLLIFLKIRFDFVNLFKKVLMLVLIIASIQFLNVMPSLNGLPFGRGEGSYDIKLVAAFLGVEGILQHTAVLGCLLLLLMAVLLLMLIMDENNIKRMSELREKSEQELIRAQMRTLESRTYMELNHLVHDLKSPLTSVQALVGVVKLSCEKQGNQREVRYLDQVEASIDRMSGMISEILNGEHFTVTTPGQVIQGLMSQISVAEYVDLVFVDNQLPDVKIEVNVTRFSRALVNLIENSYFAVDPKKGEIWISVFPAGSEGEPKVCFSVKDNGVGIAREALNHVWEEGYSTRSSHGLGLSFVEKVVTQSGGTIEINSSRGQGTEVRIVLPVCQEKEWQPGADRPAAEEDGK